jgi:hypothetical protein
MDWNFVDKTLEEIKSLQCGPWPESEQGEGFWPSIPAKLVTGGGGEEGEKHEGVKGDLLEILGGVGEVRGGLPTARQRWRPGRTARRRSGVRAWNGGGREAARGWGVAEDGVSAGGAAVEEWGDVELELTGVRVAMAVAFRGVGVEKKGKNASMSFAGYL